jgi:membrane-associated phospholipid phosphatase
LVNPDDSKTGRNTARLLADVLNPFSVFTALYALVAFSGAGPARAALYVAVELAAASLVALYVFALRRGRRVGDFWLSARSERLVPALFLLSAFAALLVALALLDAPQTLFYATLSMGLAAASVAALTLFWKASAHAAVAGHAAAVGLLVLGPLGVVFALVLPVIVWARVASGAHTLQQVLAGGATGAVFAFYFLA